VDRVNGEDLDEVIVLYREVLDLQSLGHPDRAASLNNSPDVLCTGFKHRINDKDIDEANTLVRAAQDSWPVGHPHQSKSLNNLARTLSIPSSTKAMARTLMRRPHVIRKCWICDQSVTQVGLRRCASLQVGFHLLRAETDPARSG
jgi:hypothetical protein